MRVEILSLSRDVAHCEVTDGGDTMRFSCGFGSGAHEALQHMIRNAAHALMRKRADDVLRNFAGKADAASV